MHFNVAWDLYFPPGWRAVEHRHPKLWEVMVVTEGTLAVHVDGAVHEATPGSIFIHPPESLHWEETKSPTRGRMLGLFWKAQNVRAARKLVRQGHDLHGHVAYALAWINRLQNEFGNHLPVIEGLMNALLFECQSRPSAIGDHRMERVRSYILQAGHEELTVGTLARVAHMSERHFAREFERRTGDTPMAYVRRMRLKRAETAITQTDQTLRAIALDCGFRDEFEFSRVFRRERGFPPSALRAKRNRKPPDA